VLFELLIIYLQVDLEDGSPWPATVKNLCSSSVPAWLQLNINTAGCVRAYELPSGSDDP